MKKAVLIISFLFIILHMRAQEFICQISVTAPQLAGTDKRIFETLQNAIYEFFNNRKWSGYNFTFEERLECSILLTINDRLGSDEFKGTLNLVLRRPVLNTAYNTILLNYIDKEFQFRYSEYQPLDYSDGSFTSNLTSVLAFYSYMFLGLYFDSFSPYGGSAYFEKAQSIVNSAQNAQELGWKAYEGTKNRFWMVENIQNSANSELRDFLYKFNRLGLDVMYDKLELGRTSVTESLDLLQKMYIAKPDLFMLQLILDTKRDELVNIYSDQRVPPMEKTNVVNLLKEIDPANGSKYQAILESK
jgi:Domain of unknown function (DUF4835)